MVLQRTRRAPSPRWGSGWGAGGQSLSDGPCPLTRLASQVNPGSSPGQALSPLGRGGASGIAALRRLGTRGMTRTLRIGCGAGFAGDRLEPALVLAERGGVNWLGLECLGERDR